MSAKSAHHAPNRLFERNQHIADLFTSSDTLVATDLGWTSGKGPDVEGPAEAILMAIAGRPAALDDLSGSGLSTLATRMPATPQPAS